MNLQPLKDKVVIEPIKEAEKTKGGIIVAGHGMDAPKNSNTGIIIAMGRDVKELLVGDKVLFAPYAGLETVLDEKKYLTMLENDILAVIR